MSNEEDPNGRQMVRICFWFSTLLVIAISGVNVTNDIGSPDKDELLGRSTENI